MEEEKANIERAKTQKFIRRLFTVVNDDNIPEITWSNDGKTIFIPNKEKFRLNAMSHISKAKEYTAFLRSLHHYGFFKLKRPEDDADEYYHKLFVRDGEEQLSLIRRINEKGRGTAHELRSLKEELGYLQHDFGIQQQNIFQLTNEVISLRGDLEKQDKTISGLLELLSKVFRQGFANDAHYVRNDERIQPYYNQAFQFQPLQQSPLQNDFRRLALNSTANVNASMNNKLSHSESNDSISLIRNMSYNYDNSHFSRLTPTIHPQNISTNNNNNTENIDPQTYKRSCTPEKKNREAFGIYSMPEFNNSSADQKDLNDEEDYSNMFF